MLRRFRHSVYECDRQTDRQTDKRKTSRSSYRALLLSLTTHMVKKRESNFAYRDINGLI